MLVASNKFAVENLGDGTVRDGTKNLILATPSRNLLGNVFDETESEETF